MTYFLLRDYNILPKKELHFSPWVVCEPLSWPLIQGTLVRPMFFFQRDPNVDRASGCEVCETSPYIMGLLWIWGFFAGLSSYPEGPDTFELRKKTPKSIIGIQ